MIIKLVDIVVDGKYQANTLCDALKNLTEDVANIAALEPKQPIMLQIVMMTTTSIDNDGNKTKNNAWAVCLHTDVMQLTQPELFAYAEERAEKLKEDLAI